MKSLPLLALTVVVASFLSTAQNAANPGLHGVVTSKDGKPLADVVVYASAPRECCAKQAQRTTTDATGSFHMDNPPRVLHFFKDQFAPASRVVDSGQKEIGVVLEDEAPTRWILPACPDKIHAKAVGWPYQFLVPKRPKIKKRFGDDYLIYLTADRTKEYSLVIWFGPLVGGLDADDDWLIQAASFSERSVRDGTQIAGQDFRGLDKQGRHWRWTGLAGYNIARYRNASDAAAEYFDRIIDSACVLKDERAQ